MILTIDIKDQNGNVTNHWEGASQAEADQWVTDNESSFPDGYQKVQADVTADRQALADEQDGAAARALGSRVIDRLRGVNLRKGFTLDQLTALASDPQIQLAKVLLDTGAPGFAYQVIQAVGPKYYTADEITQILDPIAPPAST